MKKSVPRGVRIISVVDYILGSILIVLGLLALLDLQFININYSKNNIPVTLDLMFYFGIFAIITGILFFVLDFNLMAKKHWALAYRTLFAWTLLIIHLVFLKIYGKDLVIIFLLIYCGITGVYLLFNRDVKRNFY